MTHITYIHIQTRLNNVCGPDHFLVQRRCVIHCKCEHGLDDKPVLDRIALQDPNIYRADTRDICILLTAHYLDNDLSIEWHHVIH